MSIFSISSIQIYYSTRIKNMSNLEVIEISTRRGLFSFNLTAWYLTTLIEFQMPLYQLTSHNIVKNQIRFVWQCIIESSPFMTMFHASFVIGVHLCLVATYKRNFARYSKLFFTMADWRIYHRPILGLMIGFSRV